MPPGAIEALRLLARVPTFFVGYMACFLGVGIAASLDPPPHLPEVPLLQTIALWMASVCITCGAAVWAFSLLWRGRAGFHWRLAGAVGASCGATALTAWWAPVLLLQFFWL